MSRHSCLRAFGLLLAGSSLAVAQFVESEPNDNKAAAYAVNGIVAGGTITGNTTGSSTVTPGAGSADYFRVKTGAAPLGIYRHRLVITTTGAVGHVGTIRGLTQTAGVPNAGSDSTIQTSSTITTPARMNQWYGFGKEEELFYRVTGLAATTGDYTATLVTDSVTPINLGSHSAGSITIARAGHFTDTDFWVYDSNLNPIPNFGNDDPNVLTQTYAPGTYYLAYTNFNFANNLGSAGNPGETFLSGAVLDFPSAAANSSTTTIANLGIGITSGCGTVVFPAAKTGGYDIVWGTFTVTPAFPLWETNDPVADLSLNGLQNPGGNAPIALTSCIGAVTNLSLSSSNNGLPWDLLITTAPLIGSGPSCGATGIRTTGGQAVNLDIAGNPASIFSLNGAFWFLNPWAGNLNFPITSTVPFGPIGAQFFILDPAHADGLRLSAAGSLTYNTPTSLPAPIAGPALDDSTVTVNVGCVPFFGQLFTQLHVSSNGRVTFGAADSAFAPAIASTTTGVGWFGHWADLAPSAGPVTNFITIDSPAANVFRVHYETAVLFTGGEVITSDLVLDANDGSLTISGLPSLPFTNTSTMMIGVCKGGAGGTDPGATVFGFGGPNAPAGPSAAIYAFDSVMNLVTALAGVGSLRFEAITAGPNAGGYQWLGL